MPFVYSTSTCDNIFPVYTQAEPGQAATIKRSVLIRGGANLAKGKLELVTKYGVRTEISDEDLAILKNDTEFNNMVQRGFMKIDERKRNAEEVAADMNPRDESAPLTPNDYPEGDDSDDVKAKPKDAGAIKKNTDEDED